MRWRIGDRLRGLFAAVTGAAFGAILLPGLFVVWVLIEAFFRGTGGWGQLAEAGFNFGILLGFVGLFAATMALGFAIVMAFVVHEALRRLRWRSVWAFIVAGGLLYLGSALLLALAVGPTMHWFAFYPIAIPSVVVGSLLFARRMRGLDSRAGDPWP